MSHSRNIYFDDETFKLLEDMILYDSKGKELSRSNKVKHLVHKNMKDARTADAKHFDLMRKYIDKVIFQIAGLEFVQVDEKEARRIKKALELLETIKAASY